MFLNWKQIAIRTPASWPVEWIKEHDTRAGIGMGEFGHEPMPLSIPTFPCKEKVGMAALKRMAPQEDHRSAR